METNHKIFKPFDKVLVREGKKWPWRATFYSHYNTINGHHYTTSGAPINDILPYEGNEHLVGTTDEPETEVRLEKGEWVMCKTQNGNWVLAKYKDHNELPWTNIEVEFSNGNVVSVDVIIRFGDFIPYDMEGTKKHILCVKNGKVVKYKV